MNSPASRRKFLCALAGGVPLAGLGDLSFLTRLPGVPQADTHLGPKAVQFRPEIEPIVRLLEETPRARLLEEVGARIKGGLAYRDVVAALLLAGIRNIQPRPVGFKFHAVLVVNSAHLASIASADADRWLPIFWALDYFKDAQARDVREGDWTMGPVAEQSVPAAAKARQAFTEAMDNWDEAAADAAVTGLARTAGVAEILEIFSRYGARDFRDIGHKAIYVANGWRTLQEIGWQHAEPVLRSVAYALLYHEGGNPAQRDAPADRPWRQNRELAARLRKQWDSGKPSDEACADLLAALREASAEGACAKVVEILNGGVAPRSVWDALFQGAGELLMRRPGIVSLHAVTSTNALHFAYRSSNNDETRKLLMLQNAAFLTLFRGDLDPRSGIRIDSLEPLPVTAEGPAAVEEILAEASRDRMAAARKALAFLERNPDPALLMHAARRLVFLKGRDSHDYKFSSALLEDFHQLSAAWRNRYLAAGMFQLRGSGAPENDLVRRTRAAFAS